jgi:hypothetical protein
MSHDEMESLEELVNELNNHCIIDDEADKLQNMSDNEWKDHVAEYRNMYLELSEEFKDDLDFKDAIVGIYRDGWRDYFYYLIDELEDKFHKTVKCPVNAPVELVDLID